jgi:chromosome segregation ATPase
MTFDLNELRDKCEIEHNLRVEAEKAYDKVASEAYDMHQQITNLTIENTRLENKIEELMEEHTELEADYDALVQTKREYAEEIDRLRKVVTNLQSTRFTTDEFLRMIAREFMPSTGKGFADSVDF